MGFIDLTVERPAWKRTEVVGDTDGTVGADTESGGVETQGGVGPTARVAAGIGIAAVGLLAVRRLRGRRRRKRRAAADE